LFHLFRPLIVEALFSPVLAFFLNRALLSSFQFFCGSCLFIPPPSPLHDSSRNPSCDLFFPLKKPPGPYNYSSCLRYIVRERQSPFLPLDRPSISPFENPGFFLNCPFISKRLVVHISSLRWVVERGPTSSQISLPPYMGANRPPVTFLPGVFLTGLNKI